jgi:hypothetical protein
MVRGSIRLARCWCAMHIECGSLCTDFDAFLKVVCAHHLVDIPGTKFDSSHDRGQTFDFTLGQVGWPDVAASRCMF